MTYLKVFTDFRELMAPLNAEEKGRLFEAIAKDGEGMAKDSENAQEKE